MRGLLLFVLGGLIAMPAEAKQLPASYGYGRTAADAAPVLDLRGLLPPGPDSGPLLPPAKPARKTEVAAPPYGRLTASCYANDEDRETASGEAYNPVVLSAAHPNMPLSSLALITNARNGKEVIVRVNDRPASGLGIEMSPAAAEALGEAESCRAEVTIRRLGAAPYASRAPRQTVATPVFLSRPEAKPARGAFLVQVGAFSQRANAEAAQAQAAAAGPVSIEPAFVGGISLYRVRLGPWASREEAEQAREAAEALGFAGAKLTTP